MQRGSWTIQCKLLVTTQFKAGLNLFKNLKKFICFKFSLQGGQFLKPYSEQLDMSTFFISNLHLFAFIILGYLLIAAIATILPRLVGSNYRSPLKSLRLVLSKASFMDYNRLPRVHLKLMFFFFGLFLFFNLNFIGGIIKTDKCTVDSSDVVDSQAKLIGTSKTLATSMEYINLIKKAPKKPFSAEYPKRKFYGLVVRRI